MANESVRSFRGWIYAILVAICLMLVFFASENLSRMKQPGFYHAPRTSTLSISTKPKNFPKIATESIPLDIESQSAPMESASWIDYRIASENSIALLEPPAGARLAAPISSSIGADPFLEANRNQRSPSVLAESAASESQIVANNVSTVRVSEANEPFERTILSVDRLPHATNNTWPSSIRLLNEIEKTQTLAVAKSATEASDWISRVATEYDRLTHLSLTDEASSRSLETLHGLADEGIKIADSLKENDATIASEIARLSYSIERRYTVWIAVSRCVLKGKTQLVAVRSHAVDTVLLKECLANVEVAIKKTGDAASWNQYLMLDALKQLAASEITGRQGQVDLVRQFLGRVTDSNVSELQRAILASTEVHKLADQVHPLSIGPVDYRK